MEMQKVMQEKEAWPKSDLFFMLPVALEVVLCVSY